MVLACSNVKIDFAEHPAHHSGSKGEKHGHQHRVSNGLDGTGHNNGVSTSSNGVVGTVTHNGVGTHHTGVNTTAPVGTTTTTHV
jgi:hypothetical protein